MANLNISQHVRLSLYTEKLPRHNIEFSDDPYGEYEDDLFTKFDKKENKKEEIRFIDEFATIIFIDKEVAIKD